MNSMTGYGKGFFERDDIKITVEIKSVNHRFLDLNVKLPRLLNFAEDGLRKKVKSSLSRGHLDIYISLEDLRQEKMDIDVNFELAKKYFEVSEILSRKLGVENDFSVQKLMRNDDVVLTAPIEEDEAILEFILEKALMTAINGLNAMRAHEGEALVTDVLSKVGFLRGKVAEIEKQAPTALAEQKKKLQERVRELLGDVQIDEARLLNEVAFMSDKTCVDEEILRLNAHFDHFENLIKENKPNGRQLDFIVQEMNRESNTIGSKCNNIDISNAVVMLKTEIEKIREQVQNLE